MSREFSGTGQYLGRTASVPVTGYPYTLAGWIYGDANDGKGLIGLKVDNNDFVALYATQVTGSTNAIRFGHFSGTWNEFTSTDTWNENTWSHVAVIVTNATSRRIVVNGDWASSVTDTDSSSPGTFAEVYLAIDNPANGQTFAGRLDYWGVWASALSQANVEALAGPFSGDAQSGNGAHPLAVGTAVAFWELAGTASPEPDDAGDYDLTLTGSPTQGASRPSIDSLAGNTDRNPAAGAIVAVGGAPLINPQFAAPITDTSAGGWTPSTGGSLFGVIDEVVRDDGDYMQSATNPSSDTTTLKLATISDPGTDAGFEVESACGATGSTGTVVISIRQGNSPGSEIAAWTHSNLPVGSYARFRDGVSSAQAANITDFADLYIRFVAS